MDYVCRSDKGTPRCVDPILDSVVGLLELLDGILGFDFDKMDEGINEISRSILKSITAPLTIILDLFAKMSEGFANLAYSLGWKKIGDNCKETAESARWLAEQIRSGADSFDLVEEEAKSTYHGIEKGNKGAGDSFIVLKKEGTATFDSLFATASTDSIKSSSAWQTASNVIGNAINGVTVISNHVFGNVSSTGGKAAKELTDQFTSALSPTAGFNLGKTFGDNIQKGMNPSGIGWNLGAQMAANAQAALNMSPLQLKATINATITGVNANDKWKAALAAAGVSTAGFATGGFPTPSTLFYAGEVPGQAEMLGTIGGRTAVAGGEEITGIREAVYESSQREEAMLRAILNAVNAKDLNLVANATTGRWVNKALKSYAGVTG